jgi:hypothetical protein
VYLWFQVRKCARIVAVRKCPLLGRCRTRLIEQFACVNMCLCIRCVLKCDCVSCVCVCEKVCVWMCVYVCVCVVSSKKIFKYVVCVCLCVCVCVCMSE